VFQARRAASEVPIKDHDLCVRPREALTGRTVMARQARLNYSFAPKRIERLKATQEFRDIGTSTKKGKEREEEILYGKSVQEDIVLLLSDMDGRRVYHDRDEFRKRLESAFKGFLRVPPYFWDVMMEALSEEVK
jgi:hypothetical protein